MADKPIVNIVTTQCQPQDEAKFNTWYNTVHIPMLMKFKKVQEVIRYQVIDEKLKVPRFIAIYKFPCLKDFREFLKSPEFEEAMKEMQASWGNKCEVVSVVQHEFVRDFKK